MEFIPVVDPKPARGAGHWLAHSPRKAKEIFACG